MLKIYNSLTNKIEPFKSIDPEKVNMYVCGPTVYDDIHIGNGRPVVFFDVVKLYLTHLDYWVTYASNITDIDDKIINRAKELGITEKRLAKKYAQNFFEVARAVGGGRFDHTPHATNYIKSMVRFIDKLIKKGFAYETESGIYFRVDKVKDYGILSNQQRSDLKTGVRIDLETDKEKDYDFALWKKTDEGVKYEAPWGEGRPGWHTECVVMTTQLFKGKIDIHGGGFDLKFPHHENEIAQSVALHDHHLANYWMHVGRLDLDNEKMSKSLGNDIKLKDLIQNYHPNAYRMLILAHHYRQPIHFSNELMEQYQKAYDRISYTMNKSNFDLKRTNQITDEMDENLIHAFETYMNDDFGTPRVISLIDQQIKSLNKAPSSGVYNALAVILRTIGITYVVRDVVMMDVKNYKAWVKAREEKDYESADMYRARLAAKGYL